MTHRLGALILTTALTGLAAPALAQSQGDWTLGIGVINVNPKSDNGSLAGASVTVDDDTQVSLTAEYFFMDNLGVELLAATPFEHDISLNGVNIGSTQHLPPTLSLNYHFPTQSAFKPYVGVGLNYTTFFSEESTLGTLKLDDSFGWAASVGLDYQVGENGALRINVRYMDIDTDVSLNGTNIGSVEIDPVVINLAYVHRF